MTTVTNPDEKNKENDKICASSESKNEEENSTDKETNEKLNDATTKDATASSANIEESTAAIATTNDESNTTNTNNIPDDSVNVPNSPSSSSSTSKTHDLTFEPTVDMMVNDFDDEATLEEEEALAAQESEDPSNELSSLQKESEMPIEELLALYNCQPPVHSGRIGSRKRAKKRRKMSDADENGESTAALNENIPAEKERKIELIDNNDKEAKEDPPEKLEDDVEPDKSDIAPETEKSDGDDGTDEKNEVEEDAEEEMSEVDGDGETEIDGVGADYDDDDDDGDADSKEISQLRKLYPETYGDKRLLRTISRQQSDEEEDVDYSPDEDEKKKTIMVGSEFQASIPEGFSKYDDVLPYENEDKLLWDPSRLNEDQTEEYLTKAHEQSKINNSSNSNNIAQIGIDSIPCGKHLRDDEQALYLLLQCGHNVEEALRRKRINPVPSTDQMSIWSEEECKNFESVLRLYGKDFHTIKHAKVHTRSVNEIVQFYYLWKKTERHDVFANKARLEKKKYNLNPGLTDYMDRFLEELDTTNNSSGSSSNATGNLIGNNNILRRSNERSPSPSSSGAINGSSGGGCGTESNDVILLKSITTATSTATTTTSTATTTTNCEIDLTDKETSEHNRENANDKESIEDATEIDNIDSSNSTPPKSLISTT